MTCCSPSLAAKRARLLFVGALAALSACRGADDVATTTMDVEIQFDARAAGQPVRCGETLPGLGTNERASRLQDLRFYVHDVQLIDGRGKKVPVELPSDGVFQGQNVGQLDFEDESAECENGSRLMNAVLRARAPRGEYRGLSFRVGVPYALNHAHPMTHDAPLNTSRSLYWDWRLGFIFFKLDLALAETPEDKANTFEMHLGADECVDNPKAYSCDRENVPLVVLADFDPERDKVVLELSELLAASTLAQRPPVPPSSPEPAGKSGCASSANDPDCAPIFTTFGLDFASGDVSRIPQRAFVVQPRGADDPGTVYPDDAGAADAAAVDAGSSDYVLDVPDGLGLSPRIPADNQLTKAKVELGRHLFYDQRLSDNETQSCASCHKQELAFTDGRAVGLGSTGESHTRSSMSLANVAYATTLTWARPDLTSLEIQARTPLFGTEPVELGLKDNGEKMLERLRAEPKYQQLFPAAFSGAADPFTVDNVLKALASFERTLLSGNSPYDKFKGGDVNAISESAKRGERLFTNPSAGSDSFECFHCHGPPTFSDQLNHAGQPEGGEQQFHNTGLYNLDPLLGTYPEGNQGVYEVSKDNHDRGRFRAPTLRNIAVTAPYMHDGSIATLEEVVAHYARGGRLIESGPLAGDGKNNPHKEIQFIHGFPASEQDRADLVEFLKSLTDEEFLTNPAFSNPWK